MKLLPGKQKVNFFTSLSMRKTFNILTWEISKISIFFQKTKDVFFTWLSQSYRHLKLQVLITVVIDKKYLLDISLFWLTQPAQHLWLLHFHSWLVSKRKNRKKVIIPIKRIRKWINKQINEWRTSLTELMNQDMIQTVKQEIVELI